jgi:beta-mannosidase
MTRDDLLAGADWRCAAFAAGTSTTPGGWDESGWLDAPVPGTVASALLGAGLSWESERIDARDWWYRASFSASVPVADLELDGLATFADIWVNGRLVAQSASMFTPLRVRVVDLGAHNEIAIRFRSLEAELTGRRPRPRWRVARLASPNLRWVRTSLWGRLTGAVPVPPPVGPWRGVRLVLPETPRILRRRLRTHLAAGTGVLDAEIDLACSAAPNDATIEFGDAQVGAVVEASAEEGVWTLRARLTLDQVELWWPHTLGLQPLYEVGLRIDGLSIPVGSVGFRTLETDTSHGTFRFIVNGVPLFVGGACWTPLDPIGLQNDRDALRERLHLVRSGNLAMLRVSGDTVYETDAFYDLCDELGILVWQDCMLAFADPPVDEAWEASLLHEVEQNLGRLSGRPCIALVSGGSEIAQQATYSGVSLESGLPLLTERVPATVREVLGDVPYLPTSPWGGDVPTRPDTGVSHYYGVGAYLRGVDDARRAAPKFAAECLAFAVPPGRQTVENTFGGAFAAGHDPGWKRAVFRDARASWDFEDVRDHYLRELFGVDPLSVRYTDPERYLDLGRATVAILMERVFAEWRRAESASGGGLVFYLQDSLPGAGMGVLDAVGRPKSAWYALKRVLAPVAVTVSDEGLNGLIAHLHNDTAAAVHARLRIELFVDGELLVDSAERALTLPPRSSTEAHVDGMFQGFRDLSWSHRFGPLAYDVIAVRLLATDGTTLSETTHLPGGALRPVERDVGLGARVTMLSADDAIVELSARRFAQCVDVEVPGWRAEDSWFDLAPGSKAVRLHRVEVGAPLVGSVHVLNGRSIAVRGK